MYYTEITKIIEAAMKKDPTKVASYSRLLAKKLDDDGEARASKRIISVLDKMGSEKAVMDILTAMPVDQESRLDIAEIDYTPNVDSIILSKSVQDMLDDFRDTIQHKNKMMSLGLDFWTTLLLYGPPGCGKTSAARYLASELKLPLITARFDTLISSLLGNTAKNIHRIFDYAKKQPCILFLDEFDAIAKARDDAHEMGELKRVVNSLLQNIDDFSEEGILIAATNHAQMLDTAVWRRFQTIIEMPAPGVDEIRRFINQFPKVADESGISEAQWKSIVNSMSGFSYSDIKDIVQNMLKKVVLQEKKEIDMADYVMEVFLFRNHGNYSQEEIALYLSENGVTQAQIGKYLGVSARQVRNYLGKVEVNNGEIASYQIFEKRKIDEMSPEPADGEQKPPIGLHLHPWLTEDLLRKAGIVVKATKMDGAYRYIYTFLYKDSIEDCNKYLKSQKLPEFEVREKSA